MLHFSSLRLFQRELTAMICVFCLILWPSSELLGATHHAGPRLPLRHFAWLSPSAVWTLPWHPQFPALPFLAGFLLFKEQASSCPTIAGLCPMGSGHLFGLPHGFPLHASFFPPWPRLSPCPCCSPTPQHSLGLPHLGVSWAPQTTNADTPSGNHSLPS